MAKCYSPDCDQVAEYRSKSKAKDCRNVLACGLCTTCNLYSLKHRAYYAVTWVRLMPYMPIFASMIETYSEFWNKRAAAIRAKMQ